MLAWFPVRDNTLTKGATHDVGYGYGGVGMILMALFWFGVIALVVWAVRNVGDARTRSDESGRALEILEQRFARGEIDSHELNERRAELER